MSRSHHAARADVMSQFDDRVAQPFFRALNAILRWSDTPIEGIAQLPRGRALLVANHAFGWDVAFPMAAINAQLGRTVWVLGEHAWWRVPGLRKFAARVGVVDGTHENVDTLLQRDQLVLVLPGGLREAVKPRELRYQLLWGHRYGFVRAALRNGAPMVPLACMGADELFDFVGNPYRRGARWLGLRSFPIPLPARILPIPHKIKAKYMIGEPIACEDPAAAERDFKRIRRLRREVEGALHELIEDELARRAGFEL